MPETWYRGEGVNVIPAKPGGVANDIGDGMYLTDKLEVAQQYAQERAPNPTDRRVYSVPVNRSGLRVLDLTSDPRWRKVLDTPIPSQPGLTFEGMLRKQPASEQYKNAFTGFLASSKISLANYDVVIGYEYRSGGRQMCILYKNGQGSPAQSRLRVLFVPIGSIVPTPKSPPGTMRFGGRIGPGLRIAGGALLLIGIQVLLQWLLGKIIQKQQEEEINRQFEKLRPRIEADIRRHKAAALQLLIDGRNAFATVRLAVVVEELFIVDEFVPSPPTLEHIITAITDKDETTPKNADDGVEFDHFVAPGIRSTKTFYKMSFPLSFSQEEVELYRSYVKDLLWYDAQIEVASSSEERARLSKEQDGLIAKLNAALAE
jgi:hypothetical protein